MGDEIQIGLDVRLAVRKSLDATPEHFYIEGYATRPVIDKHNEYMPLTEVAKAMERYTDSPLVTREHGGRVIGHTVSYAIDDNGAKIKALIFDKLAQKEIDEGKLPDLSIEGFAKTAKLKVDDRTVKAYIDLSIDKIAVTREGAVPGVRHERVLKSADGKEIDPPLEVRVLKSAATPVEDGSIAERVAKALASGEAPATDGENEDDPTKPEPPTKKLPDPNTMQDHLLKHHNSMVKGGNMAGANWIMSAIASLQAAMDTLKAQEPIEQAEAKEEDDELLKSKERDALNARRAAEANYLALGKKLAADSERIAGAVKILEGREVVAKSTATVEVSEYAALKEDLGKALSGMAAEINKLRNEPIPKGTLGIMMTDGTQAVERSGKIETVAKSAATASVPAVDNTSARVKELLLREQARTLSMSEMGELSRWRINQKIREIGVEL